MALCYGLSYPEAAVGVVALAPQCFPEPRFEQALFGTRGVPGFGEALAQILARSVDPVVLPALRQAIFLP